LKLSRKFLFLYFAYRFKNLELHVSHYVAVMFTMSDGLETTGERLTALCARRSSLIKEEFKILIAAVLLLQVHGSSETRARKFES
jgi:hypothetical protein